MIVDGIDMFFDLRSKLCSKANIYYSFINDSNIMDISCQAFEGKGYNKIKYDCNRWGNKIESQELLINKIKEYLCCECSKYK